MFILDECVRLIVTVMGTVFVDDASAILVMEALGNFLIIFTNFFIG
jgi:hypothetical protein